MPSLKLSNPFRRGGDRPSLKERAASLKATANRVMRRPKPVAEVPDVDWHNPPEGFMAYPAIEPAGFIIIREGLRLEAERLHDIAVREVARRGFSGDVPDYMRNGWLDQLRREHRVAELAQAVAPEKAIRVEERLRDGTVYFEDASGTARRAPVANWLGSMAQRMNGMAREEVARLFNAGAVQDQGVNGDLYDNLRRTYRLDALHDLAHRSDAVFEVSKDAVIGHWPVSPRAADETVPDPVLGLIESHRQAYADWFPRMVLKSELPLGTPEYASAEAHERGPAAREQAAYEAVLTARPSTLAGLIAWAGYLPKALAGDGVDPEEYGARACASLCDAVLSLVPMMASGSEA